MLNGQPETLEEALALLKEQQQALQAKEDELKDKDTLLKQQSEDLQKADKDLKKSNQKLNKATKELDAKDRKIKQLNVNHKLVEDKLIAKNNKLSQRLRELQVKYDNLKEQLAIKISNDFNTKAEQIKIINKDKVYRQDAGDTETGDGPKENQKKGRPNTKEKYRALPVRRFVDELPESERICSTCGSI